MADTQDSGSCAFTGVRVRLPPRALDEAGLSGPALLVSGVAVRDAHLVFSVAVDSKAELRILSFLQEAGADGLSVEELKHLTGLDRTTTRRSLKVLARRGRAERVDTNLYAIASARGQFEGVLRFHADSGTWSVRSDDQTVRISGESVGSAVPGDLVGGDLLSVTPEGVGMGVVSQVITARDRIVTVKTQRFRGAWMGICAELGEPLLLELPEGTIPESMDVRVVGRKRWPRKGPFPSFALYAVPSGAVPGQKIKSSDLAPHIDADVSRADDLIDQLVDGLSVPRVFPTEANEEAALVTAPKEVQGDDLTEVALVTIDGSDAKDFDDAVHGVVTDEGFRLLVAIADVSSYVTVGSALDLEARRRGCSVYLPGRVYPMLPASLSDDVCSLRPGVLRHCAWVSIDIRRDGTVHSLDAGFGTMRSRARLTYEQVQGFLDGGALEGDGETLQRDEEVLESIRTLDLIRGALHKRRVERGMLDLDMPEVRAELSDDGASVTGWSARPRLNAHRLIEECMLAANEAVAALLERAKLPKVYRNHGEPDDRKLAEFARLARLLAPSMQVNDVTDIHDVQSVLNELSGTPLGPVLSSRLLRSLPRASYGVSQEGHFGLGARSYLHFTSPIRRYPDLENHRMLRVLLAGDPQQSGDTEGDDDVRGDATKRLVASATSSNSGENFATQAERWSSRLLGSFVMRDLVGDVFDATVQQVASFGLFVSVAEPLVQGLVPMRELGDEYFEVDERRQEVIGRSSRTRIRLGDQVTVQCISVDVSEGKITFGIYNGPGSRGASASARKQSARKPGGGRRASSSRPGKNERIAKKADGKKANGKKANGKKGRR